MLAFKHTITVHLSTDGQKAAILAGEPSTEKQTYVVEGKSLLTRLLALPFAEVGENGCADVQVPHTVWFSSDGGVLWSGSMGTFRYSGSTYTDHRPANAEVAIGFAEMIVARVNAESVGIKKQAEIDRERQIQKEREERDARINEALTLEMSKLIEHHSPTQKNRMRYQFSWQMNRAIEDARGHRKADEIASLARLVTKEIEERTAREQKETEEAQKKEAEDVKALRAWGTRYDDLARAVAEDYDVMRAVVKRVVLDLKTACQKAMGKDAFIDVIRVNTSRHSDTGWEERSAPLSSQLNARDVLKNALKNVEVPSPITFEVSRVMRIELAMPHDDEYESKPSPKKMTGVLVFVTNTLRNVDNSIIVVSLELKV